MVAKAGMTTLGPSLLHVGERPKGDKNFETSEIVMAAPGTVVAPIPKGMPVNEENALALILAQVLKAGMPKGNAGVTPSADGSVTSANDPYGITSAAAQYAKILADYGISTQQLQQAAASQAQNNSLAQQQLAQNTQQMYLTQQNQNNAQQSKQQSDAAQVAQAQAAAQAGNSVGNMPSPNDAALALQKLLGMRGLDIQQQEANQQGTQIGNEYALGQEANRLRGQEINNQFALGNRGFDLQAMSDEFNRIMRGVSEASLPGVRAGTVPTQGVYG